MLERLAEVKRDSLGHKEWTTGMAQGQCTKGIMINKDLLYLNSSEAGVIICLMGNNITSSLVDTILSNGLCTAN